MTKREAAYSRSTKPTLARTLLYLKQLLLLLGSSITVLFASYGILQTSSTAAGLAMTSSSTTTTTTTIRIPIGDRRVVSRSFAEFAAQGTFDHSAALQAGLAARLGAAAKPEAVKAAAAKLNSAVERVKSKSKSSIGNLLFTRPTSMRVDQAYYVTLRVAKDPKANLSEDLEGILENRRVKVASIMKATLSGNTEVFHMDELTTAEQALKNEGYTEWKWQITPHVTGKHPIRITVARLVKTDVGPAFEEERVLDEEFPVTITAVERIKKFAANNWQWLWGAVTAPPIIFLTVYRRLKDRRDQEDDTLAKKGLHRASGPKDGKQSPS